MKFDSAAVTPDRTEYLKNWYVKNKVRILERNKKRYVEKKAEIYKKQREWIANNHEVHLERIRKYRSKNLEKCRKASRESNRRNKAKIYAKTKLYRKDPNIREKNLASSRAWASRNRESLRAYNREYRLRNQEKLNASNKAWRTKNKAKCRAYVKEHSAERASVVAKRRALTAGSVINLKLIKEWMANQKSKPSAVCYWCQNRISTDKIHFDHIVSLSKGGPHCIENLCVSCAPCNLSKNNRSVRVWTKIGQQFLEL